MLLFIMANINGFDNFNKDKTNINPIIIKKIHEFVHKNFDNISKYYKTVNIDPIIKNKIREKIYNITDTYPNQTSQKQITCL